MMSSRSYRSFHPDCVNERENDSAYLRQWVDSAPASARKLAHRVMRCEGSLQFVVAGKIKKLRGSFGAIGSSG